MRNGFRAKKHFRINNRQVLLAMNYKPDFQETILILKILHFIK